MKVNINRKAFIGFTKHSFGWFETVFVGTISIVVWVQSDSLTATSTEHNFFWPVFGPLLIALRYGFAKGFICALITTAGLATIMNFTGHIQYYPLSLAIGTIMVAMIAGEFQDYWHNINSRHILDHQYMAQKLESFTQNYHLLKVSHDQLEQRTAGQTVSLRSSINALQKVATRHAEHRLEHLGHPFLNLMAEVGGLEVAGIYKVHESKIASHPEAVLGDHHQLVKHDPMLLDMLATQKLLSPAKLSENKQHQSRYQLCIPLMDTMGNMQAAIIAESAKFFMLTPANIAILSLVANHAADLLSDDITTPILQPDQNDLFITYLKRAKYNKRHYGADSSLVICIDSKGKYKHALDSLINYRRGADVYWSCQTQKGQPALAVLLPLTTIYDAQLYINRLQELLNISINDSLKDIDIIGPLSMATDRKEIRHLMNELGAYNETLVGTSDDRL